MNLTARKVVSLGNHNDGQRGQTTKPNPTLEVDLKTRCLTHTGFSHKL